MGKGIVAMIFTSKRTAMMQGAALLLAVALVSTGCSFHRKKYENPITKDTEQPDKVLYDKAIKDIEKSRFEIARLTLNTLINTYVSSVFLAKAKLAIADSWMRQAGAEGLAQAEDVAAGYYHHKGSFAAAANRYTGLVGQYPLYSRADEALWNEGDSYSHLGPRFRQKAGDAYTKIVRDYPLSQYADLAKKKLVEMELPVPEADPAAVERMKYEAANHEEPGMIHKATDFIRRNPDMSSAAKSGTPTMVTPAREIPATVPVPADAAGFSGDVTVAPVTGTSALDTQPDARTAAQPAADATAKPADDATTQTPADSKASSSKKKKK